MKQPLLLIAVSAGVVCSALAAASNRTAPVRKSGKLVRTAKAVIPKPAAPAVAAKPLTSDVRQGLGWLVKHQLPNGAWGQGEESQEMGSQMAKLAADASVADTCMALMALMRAGNTPAKGEYAPNVRKGVDYVCGEVERAEEKGLYITKTLGTRVQGKLGPYIDTFLAALVLAELKGKMPDPGSEKRLMAALDKTMDKIEKNQKPDGTWGGDGWAPVLSQSVASKALNRASQNGVKVSEKTRERAEVYARGQFDAKSGGFGGAGAAGVQLYSAAGNLGSIQDSENANLALENEVRARVKTARTAGERQQAQRSLDRFAQNRKDLAVAKQAVVTQLENPEFVAGFGSNGGEEFLSYLNIGESLLVKGGEQWKKWDRSMTENLYRVQNGDGSWSGHHCITGRTFCTAAALMVLTVDRAPVPVAQKISRR
jgi:hypothetical protein